MISKISRNNESIYNFNNLDELYETARQLPDVERTGDVIAVHPDKEDADQIPWRNSIYTREDEPRLAGEVSSSNDYYNIIQYGDVLQTLGKGIEQHEEITPSGEVAVSATAHKMSAKIGLDQQIEASPGDEIEMQLHTRTGHSGYHGLKFAVGAERLVCSNGMTAFIEDQVYEQTHGKPFQKGLAYHAIDSIIEGSDVVERRLQQAQERELMNQDEAVLVLKDLGIDRFLDNPTTDLLNAVYEEVDDPESPSLYETFNAATYALSHLAKDDVPQYAIDEAHEEASQLLEYGNGIPDPGILGENAVERRYNEFLEEPEETEEYWEGEREALGELAEVHGITA